MREQPRHHLIAIHSSLDLGDTRVSGIDQDRCVIGTGSIRVVGIPVDIDVDAPVISIPSCLRCRYILVVTGKDSGGKELLVCDFTPMFVQKLLDTFVTYSCHWKASFLKRSSDAWGQRSIPESQFSKFPDPLGQKWPC